MGVIRMFLFILLVSVSNQALMSQESVKIQKLVVCKYDKTEVSFLLSDLPVISFKPEFKDSYLSYLYKKMVVATEKEEMEFYTFSLDKMHVVSIEEVTDIADLVEDCEFVFKGNALLVDVKSGIATVELYTVDGKKVLSKCLAVGRHALQLSELAKGNHIVKVNDNTFKIRIR